jgi:hypothetical protein
VKERQKDFDEDKTQWGDDRWGLMQFSYLLQNIVREMRK